MRLFAAWMGCPSTRLDDAETMIKYGMADVEVPSFWEECKYTLGIFAIAEIAAISAGWLATNSVETSLFFGAIAAVPAVAIGGAIDMVRDVRRSRRMGKERRKNNKL